MKIGDFVMVKRELPLATSIDGKYETGPHMGVVKRVFDGGLVVEIRSHEFLIKNKEASCLSRVGGGK